MRNVITKVYQFNELSDKAKEVARNWYRENCLDYEWYDGVYEDAIQIGKLLGIDIDNIYFRGFSSQGDGACFEGTFRASDLKRGAVKKHAPKDKELHEIAKEFERISKQFPFCNYKVKQSGHYNHENCTDFTVSIVDFELNEINTKEAADAETNLIKVSRQLMKWIYRQLEKDWNYLNEDKQVDESIESNGYTFTESGKRFG